MRGIKINISISGSNYSIGTYAFATSGEFSNSGSLSVSLGQGLKTIGANAFVSCLKLNSLTIPSSVTEISGNLGGKSETLFYIMQRRSEASEQMLNGEPWGAKPENVFWMEDIVEFDHTTEVVNKEYAALSVQVNEPDTFTNESVTITATINRLDGLKEFYTVFDQTNERIPGIPGESNTINLLVRSGLWLYSW